MFYTLQFHQYLVIKQNTYPVHIHAEMKYWIHIFNSLRPSDAYMRR